MTRDPLFVGRETELRLLAERSRLCLAGLAQVVLLEGEAGVGKSAVVREWLAGEEAQGLHTLKAFGDPAESDVQFSLVDQLVSRATVEMLERFPLLREGPPPAGTSAVQVARQLLSLFDELQNHGPLVVIVEDVQWADEGSWQTLAAVLRRLEADRIMTVLTARSPVPEAVRKVVADAGGAEMKVGGLEDAGVAELIRRAIGQQATDGHAAADSSVVSRLLAHTGGNALYLRTLLSEISPETLWELPTEDEGSLPVPATLAASVQRQLARLPGPSRGLVEAVAVLGTRIPLAIAARLGGLEDARRALQPALAANLMRWWPGDPTTPVMITHALQRDAVIQAIEPVRLGNLHAAAADMVDASAAWRHRVAAAQGSDDRLAAELEVAANQHLADGAIERAATLLLWASDLATNRHERERLLLTAAARLLEVQRGKRVQPLLPRVQACSPQPMRAAVLGALALSTGALDHAERELTAAFEATIDDPAQLRTAAVATTMLAVTRAFRNESTESWFPVLERFLARPDLDPSLTSAAKSVLMFGHMCRDGPQAAFTFGEIATLPPAPQTSDALLLFIRGLAHAHSGRPESARDDLTRLLALAEQGELVPL
ncbi:AAA family ATPase [Streptomyces sp. TRM72054]|uniref:AAA family ATPase n=1 Tax=Streptomyces sp. TRM72054 TaxID=2870562 RepID=UPI001C8C9E65|nr:AAA family ATPase [Streptomyces sp. TRM72054]MBX9399254.1 AAA family ATPase [Streptomyces sp. TRM72054]